MHRSVSALALVLAAALLAGCAGGGSEGDSGDGAGPGASGVEPESGVLSGTLDVVGSSNIQPMPLSAAHERLAVTLVLTSNLPQTNVGLNVSGPDGRSDEVRTGPTLYALPGMKPTMSFGAPAVGEWVATIELRNGASAEYEVHWCADDADAPGPQDNLACQRDFD